MLGLNFPICTKRLDPFWSRHWSGQYIVSKKIDANLSRQGFNNCFKLNGIYEFFFEDLWSPTSRHNATSARILANNGQTWNSKSLRQVWNIPWVWWTFLVTVPVTRQGSPASHQAPSADVSSERDFHEIFLNHHPNGGDEF